MSSTMLEESPEPMHKSEHRADTIAAPKHAAKDLISPGVEDGVVEAFNHEIDDLVLDLFLENDKNRAQALKMVMNQVCELRQVVRDLRSELHELKNRSSGSLSTGDTKARQSTGGTADSDPGTATEIKPPADLQLGDDLNLESNKKIQKWIHYSINATVKQLRSEIEKTQLIARSAQSLGQKCMNQLAGEQGPSASTSTQPPRVELKSQKLPPPQEAAGGPSPVYYTEMWVPCTDEGSEQEIKKLSSDIRSAHKLEPDMFVIKPSATGKSLKIAVAAQLGCRIDKWLDQVRPGLKQTDYSSNLNKNIERSRAKKYDAAQATIPTPKAKNGGLNIGSVGVKQAQVKESIIPQVFTSKAQNIGSVKATTTLSTSEQFKGETGGGSRVVKQSEPLASGDSTPRADSTSKKEHTSVPTSRNTNPEFIIAASVLILLAGCMGGVFSKL